MKTVASIILGVIAVFGFFFGTWLMGSYNNLVQQDVKVDTEWAQVETQYQRRFDLVPQIVGATKGILEQEREVFGAIAEARTRYAGSNTGTREEQIEAYGQYESVVGRLLMVMENYPQLRSNEQVRALTDELTGTENRVNVARVRYNEAVETYNLTVRRFPSNLIAMMFGYQTEKYFENQDGAEVAPTVDLSLD